MKKLFSNSGFTERVIAIFGQAKLIRHFNGQFEIRGGTRHDHGEAREWASFFFHEAILSPGKQPGDFAVRAII